MNSCASSDASASMIKMIVNSRHSNFQIKSYDNIHTIMVDKKEEQFAATEGGPKDPRPEPRHDQADNKTTSDTEVAGREGKGIGLGPKILGKLGGGGNGPDAAKLGGGGA